MIADKQNIVLVSLFYYEKEDNIRISTVYNLLKGEGVEVELITTDFNHRKKQKHNPSLHPDDITFLSVPSYRSNISFRRLYSHVVFAFKLRHYLKNRGEQPSKVYCLVPAVTAGLACSHYCKKNHIPFAVDVIDLWPESFVVLSSHKVLMKFFTFPWKLIARKVYRSADLLFTGSKNYAQYVGRCNAKTKAIPVYLGTNTKRIDKLVSASRRKIVKPDRQKWICFGGMLGNSYDIDIILAGYKMFCDESPLDTKLLFIGDGQEHKKISRFQKNHGLNIEVTGFLNYADFMKYLSLCDVAVNSFKAGTVVAYSYKFNDYITAGVPVLNNVAGEMADIISKYSIGINFRHSPASFSAALSEMLTQPEILHAMKKNIKFVATTVLDQKTVYRKMLDLLKK